MVKINLKSSIPVKSSEKVKEEIKVPPKPEKKPVEPAETEAEKIFTPLDIPPPTTEPEPTPSLSEEEFQIIEQPEEELPAKKMRFRTQKEPLDLMEEKWESPSSGIFKKVLIAALILIMIGAGGVGIYKITDGFSRLPFLKKGKTPATVKKPQPTTVAPEKPVTIPAAYQENYALNQFIFSSLQQLLSKKPPTVRYALIVFSSREANLTLVSDSESKMTQMKNDLNKELRGFNLKTISSQKKVINNATMYFADLKTSLNLSQLAPAAGSISKSALSPINFSQDIQNLARKHKINAEKIQVGKRRETPTFIENPYYLTFSGSKDNLLNFLSEVFLNNPAVRINKVSLNPTNKVTFSDQQLAVRINASHINLK